MTKAECGIPDNERLLESRAESARRANALPSTPADLVHHPIPGWKRTCDILGSIVLICLLGPILAGIAVFIWLVSGEWPIYQQNRLGEMGEYFTIYKFRTISTSHNAANHRQYVADLKDTDGALEKPDFGDSIIKGGAFLRAHAIDELPQLFNVLFGSMSLVGPRPEVLDWDDYDPYHRRRLEATPGMTGLWQVSGKNELTFEEMIHLDLKYIKDRSLKFDLWILFRTLWVVINPGE